MSYQIKQEPEVESLKAPNEESRFSTKSVLTVVLSIVVLAVGGFLVSSLIKQPAKTEAPRKAAAKQNLPKIDKEVLKQPLKQASESKPLVEPIQPTAKIARMKSFFLTHKKLFIIASVITALAIAGVAYYLVSVQQFEESFTKQAERLKELEALVAKQNSEINRLNSELNNERLALKKSIGELNGAKSEIKDLKRRLEDSQQNVNN